MTQYDRVKNAESASNLSYVAEQVRRWDHDRFVTAIFAPSRVREHLFALYAFNIEIAKVGEIVSEPLIGRMRLQWWRDTLDRLFAGAHVAHGVAAPLGHAIGSAGLKRDPFERLIDAREFDLDQTPPQDLAALEAYAEGTGAPLTQLALEISGGPDPGHETVARLAGKAWALTGLIRAVPFHARQRRCYLPLELLDAQGVRLSRLYELKPDPHLRTIVEALAGLARAFVEEARALANVKFRGDRSPLLLLPLAARYLDDLERAGWDPFELARQPERPMPMIGLAIRSMLSRY